MSDSAEFAAIMGPVAEAVLPEFMGDKNKHMSSSSEWRWGDKGSVSVDLKKGTWFDHEDQTGGGVLDLLRAYRGFNTPEALEWLQERGFIQRRAGGRDQQDNGQAASALAARVPRWLEPKPIAIFEYFDDKGKLAYEVLKFPKETEGPRYMQRRPHPEGGWIWKLQEGEFYRNKSGDWFATKPDKHYDRVEQIPAATRWLYNRDEVLKAKAEGRAILLAEGEKDVETLRAWGLAATTNAGGAKYWSESFHDDLAGANVILLPDNDDTGRQRVSLRGAGLKPHVKSVRVLDLAAHWKDMPPKADVTDWKERAGGTGEKLAALIKKAPHWSPERPKSRFGAFTWSELDNPGLEQDYLVEGWWTERGRSVIGGPSKSGKSFLAIHLAMCVARGLPFFDIPVKEGAVVYQAGEGGWGIKKRFKAYRKHFEVGPDEDVPIVPLTARVNLYAKDGDTQPLIDEIKAWSLTLSKPLRLVVIDTLSTATAGANENDGKDMSVVLDHIARIEHECGVHVCLVHHMNADGKKLRGHTSIYANVDQVVLVTVDPMTKIRTALLDKQKDDEDGLKLTFSLQSVQIGANAKTGRDQTSCVVVTVDEKEKLKKEGEQFGFSVRPSEEALLIPLFKAIKKYGKFVATDKDGPAEAIGKHVVDFSYYLDVAVTMDASEQDVTAAKAKIRKNFERNTGFLVKAGIVVFKRISEKSALVWWTGKPIRGFPETFPPEMRNRTNSPQTSDISGTNSPPPLSPGMAEIIDSDQEILL